MSDLQSCANADDGNHAEDVFEKACAISKDLDIVQPRPYSQIIAGFALFLIVLIFGRATLQNEALGWSIFEQYFFSTQILLGLFLTMWLTIVVGLLAFVVGAIVAALRLSRNRVVSSLAWSYVWVFRSIPILVLLLFWFNIGYILPKLAIGLPDVGIGMVIDMRNIVTPVAAAIVALTLHESAFAAEIVRSGIGGIDAGQIEAANALALPPRRIFFRIVLPQAMRTIAPNAGSLLIGTLKTTSMVSVVSVTDLLYSAQIIYNRNFQIFALLIVATVWYLIITSLLSILQFYAERYFQRGASRISAPMKYTIDAKGEA